MGRENESFCECGAQCACNPCPCGGNAAEGEKATCKCGDACGREQPCRCKR